MAKVLLEIPQEEFSVEEVRADPRAVCLRLFEIAKGDVEDELSCPDAYVPDMDACDLLEDCILGAVEPDRLRAAVSGWDNAIRQELLQAIEKFFTPAKGIGVSQDAAPLDTPVTYALKKASIAADNCFYDFAERIVDLPNENGFTYLRALIGREPLDQIMAAPERYAIIPIYVK